MLPLLLAQAPCTLLRPTPLLPFAATNTSHTPAATVSGFLRAHDRDKKFPFFFVTINIIVEENTSLFSFIIVLGKDRFEVSIVNFDYDCIYARRFDVCALRGFVVALKPTKYVFTAEGSISEAEASPTKSPSTGFKTSQDCF